MVDAVDIQIPVLFIMPQLPTIYHNAYALRATRFYILVYTSRVSDVRSTHLDKKFHRPSPYCAKLCLVGLFLQLPLGPDSSVCFIV